MATNAARAPTRYREVVLTVSKFRLILSRSHALGLMLSVSFAPGFSPVLVVT